MCSIEKWRFRWPWVTQTPVSRSQYSLKVNISQTVHPIHSMFGSRQGFWGQLIEWRYFRFNKIQDGSWRPSWNDGAVARKHKARSCVTLASAGLSCYWTLCKIWFAQHIEVIVSGRSRNYLQREHKPALNVGDVCRLESQAGSFIVKHRRWQHKPHPTHHRHSTAECEFSKLFLWEVYNEAIYTDQACHYNTIQYNEGI